MPEKIIYLDRNENNYGPAPLCFERIRNAGLSKFSFYSKAYQKGIKSILSDRIAKEFDISEKRVVLGYGAEDLLKQLIQCYLNAGEKLMVPSYSWWYYKEIANEVNGLNVEYPLIPGKDSFYYDVDRMIALYEKEKPKILFLSSPNNPTGNGLSVADLKRITENLRDVLIVLDQAYWYDGNNQYVKNLIESNPNLLVIRTFSKYFALAGLRIGFGLMGESFSNLARFTNRYLGFNRLSEEVAIAALDSKEYYLDIAKKMDEDKEFFYTELSVFKGFTVYKSQANFILVKIPKEIMKPLKEYLTERGLIIKFMNEENLNSHLRITLGTQEENLMLISAIKAYFS